MFNRRELVKKKNKTTEYHTAIKMSYFGKLLKREYASGSEVKNLPANVAADSGDDGWGRSPGERNGNPLQYSYLGNPLDRGAWGATVHGVTKESVVTERLNKNKHVKMNVKREHGLLYIYIHHIYKQLYIHIIYMHILQGLNYH